MWYSLYTFLVDLFMVNLEKCIVLTLSPGNVQISISYVFVNIINLIKFSYNIRSTITTNEIIRNTNIKLCHLYFICTYHLYNNQNHYYNILWHLVWHLKKKKKLDFDCCSTPIDLKYGVFQYLLKRFVLTWYDFVRWP